MGRTIFAAGAVLALAWLEPATAIPANQPGSTAENIERERVELQSLVSQSRNPVSDEETLAGAFRSVVDDPAFSGLSGDEKHQAYLLYGALLYDTEKYEEARNPIRQASEMPMAIDFDWGLRFENSYRLRDFADASIAITALAQHWPQKLADYNDQAVFSVSREIQKPAANVDLALNMLGALHAAHWKTADVFSSADGLWLSLTRMRLENGDVEGAKKVANDLRDPTTFLAMQTDRRFDEIIASDKQHFEVMKGYAALLSDMQSKVAASPDKLEGVNSMSELLLTVNRPGDAEKMVSDALAHIGSNPGTFSDTNDKINWTQDIRSRALFALGRSDEAFKALIQGAAHREDGDQINVSQAINLADEYNTYGRPKDALASVAALDDAPMSSYGRMSLYDARACAYFQLGDKIDLDKTLEYMKAHVSDGAQPYLNTMLFTGNIDDAASEVIAELKDPGRRMLILGYLQDYLPPSHPTEHDKAVHASWIAVRSRPDVASEIAKVGHINQYALRLPGY